MTEVEMTTEKREKEMNKMSLFSSCNKAMCACFFLTAESNVL